MGEFPRDNPQTGAKRTSFQREQDLPIVQEHYAKGATQRGIARLISDLRNDGTPEGYTLTHKSIAADIKLLIIRWRDKAAAGMDKHIAAELLRINELERALWQGWERSCQDKEKIMKEQRMGVDKEDEDEEAQGDEGAKQKTRPVVSGGRITRTREGQAGDPSFLTKILDCIKLRCEILGLYAPKRTELAIDARVLPAQDMSEAQLMAIASAGPAPVLDGDIVDGQVTEVEETDDDATAG